MSITALKNLPLELVLLALCPKVAKNFNGVGAHPGSVALADEGT